MAEFGKGGAFRRVGNHHQTIAFLLLVFFTGWTRAFLPAQLPQRHLLVRGLSGRPRAVSLAESQQRQSFRLMLKVEWSQLSLRAAPGKSDADVAKFGEVEVKEWERSEVAGICDLLTCNGFDPEGDISMDCCSPDALKMAYDSGDCSCFLVATAAGCVVGTAALAAGTLVTTMASGASVSQAGTAAALRRAAVSVDLGQEAQEAVFEALLSEVERRAARGGCAQILALAYQPDQQRTPRGLRMTSERLAARGYKAGDVIQGTEVQQFAKKLGETSCPVPVTASSRPKEGGVARDARLLVGRGSGFLIFASVAMTLVAALGVATVLGLDISIGSVENRGLGTPLSREEVRQLMADENLKRKSLDAAQDGRERGWGDLSVEERKEEEALLQVISGKDIRLK